MSDERSAIRPMAIKEDHVEGLDAAGDVVETGDGEQVIKQEIGMDERGAIGAESENPEVQERGELPGEKMRCWLRGPRRHLRSRVPERSRTTSSTIALRGRGASTASEAKGRIPRICRCKGSTRIHLWSEYPWTMRS